MPKDAVFKDLDAQLKELEQSYPNLASDQLFTAWFAHAYITENLETAVTSVTGGPHDKNIDALIVDSSTRTVNVIQTKYRQKYLRATEKANDIYAFAAVAERLLVDTPTQFDEFAKDANARVAELLKDARQKLSSDGWTLSLIYVTLGKGTRAVIERAERLTRKLSPRASFDFIPGDRLKLLLRDYLDGAAPPVASIELTVESGEGVHVRSTMKRYDESQKIDAWVLPVRGSDVGRLFLKHGRRIFARNVRGYMGDKTHVNRGMEDTLTREPLLFFYLNNGLTMVCDAAEKTEEEGREILRITNPQIINGQQTTRVLAQNIGKAEKTSVVVRVIKVPRGEQNQDEKFESLITQIVQGTNWQNAISQADLMSNDRRQIQLERAFRSKSYVYLRKREKKSESGTRGFVGKYILRKEELARAVAGCTLDPAIVRAGIDNLFDEDYYNKVFPNSKIGYYLPKYWLMRAVNRASLGSPRQGYMKWLVLNFAWNQLREHLGTQAAERQFWEACQISGHKIHQPLNALVNVLFRAVDAFYKANRKIKGRDGDWVIQDESNFFKNRRGLPDALNKYWRGPKCSRHRLLFTRHLDKLLVAMY